MTIDEAFFRRPESGVLDAFAGTGVRGFFAENYLWTGLLGVVFWEELFENDRAELYNEFDRVPATLAGGGFYDLHREAIDRKLARFDDRGGAVAHAPHGALGKLLRHLAEDFSNRSTGFPDLATIEAGELRFYEVKAPGDQLRRQQVLQLLALQRAGFSVEVLQIAYAYNPNQPYEVVDVETTGGKGPYHRITEIGAVKVTGGKILERFQTLVNPERPMPREIQALTGITNEMVRTAPPFRAVADAFEAFTLDAILVAHNVAFDTPSYKRSSSASSAAS